MQRELLILRHGKSDWSVDVDDFQRPIMDRGKRGAQRMGVWLAQQHLIPDYIVSSPAERAITTAEKCAKVMGLSSRDIHQDSDIYEATLSDLLYSLKQVPETAKRVLIVGHNPGLEFLLLFLAKNQIEIADDGKLLPTATLAHLKMPDDWHTLEHDCGDLQQIVRPKSLPKGFPFPDCDSEELRERPSYYYSQSSVIPYRLKKGKLEILVIRSSQNKHLVVPKGIIEPSFSSQESAAKEAEEEAGIFGKIDQQPLGQYSYEKWGSTCEVQVFPMRVTDMIPEDEWEESHRGREWVSVRKAAERLKQQQLIPMLQGLEEKIKDQ